jgi:hypothetical protein
VLPVQVTISALAVDARPTNSALVATAARKNFVAFMWFSFFK